MNSFFFCFSESLYFSFTLKDNFTGYIIPDGCLLSPNTVNNSLHSLFMVSEKLDISLIFIPLYRIIFPLASFRIFSLSLILCNLKLVCLGAVLFLFWHLSKCPLSFLDL